MYYYTFKSDLGYVPRFTEESNTLLDRVPEGWYASYKSISDSFKDTRHALIVQPIAGSPGLITRDGSFVSKEEIMPLVGKRLDKPKIGPGEFGMRAIRTGVTNETPAILATPINIQDLSPEEQRNITYLPVNIPGHSPIVIAVIIAAVIIVAVVGSVIVLTTKYLKEKAEAEAAAGMQIAYQNTMQEYYETKQAEYDYLSFRAKRLTHDTYDLNNDGEDDKAIDSFGDGRTIEYATSDYGVSLIGSDINTVTEANPLPDPVTEPCPIGTVRNEQGICEEYEWLPWEKEGWEDLIYWGIIAAVVIGGVIVAVKVLPKALERRKE